MIPYGTRRAKMKNVIDLLKEAKLVSTNGEARRLIRGAGVTIVVNDLENTSMRGVDQAANNPKKFLVINEEAIFINPHFTLFAGKKNHAVFVDGALFSKSGAKTSGTITISSLKDTPDLPDWAATVTEAINEGIKRSKKVDVPTEQWQKNVEKRIANIEDSINKLVSHTEALKFESDMEKIKDELRLQMK